MHIIAYRIVKDNVTSATCKSKTVALSYNLPYIRKRLEALADHWDDYCVESFVVDKENFIAHAGIISSLDAGYNFVKLGVSANYKTVERFLKEVTEE